MAKSTKERARKQAIARTRKATSLSNKSQSHELSAETRAAKTSAGKSESATARRANVKTTSSKQAIDKATIEGKTAARNAGSELVTIDRRRGDRRGQGSQGSQGGQCSQGTPVAVERRQLERRAKVNRRRQIDPTTCERDYSQDEIEFMAALDAYKRASGRMFPTCSEVLEVLRGLGYERRPVSPPTLAEASAVAPEESLLGMADETLAFAAHAACDAMIPVPAGA